MKKISAILLTGCMILQTLSAMPTPAFGADVRIKEEALAEEAASILDVEVRSSRLLPYHGAVNVTLSGNGGKWHKTLDFENADTSAQTARFSVAAGDYDVAIETDRYADYTQKVHVEENWITRITACPAKPEQAAGGTPGLLCIGDVNNDGVVNKTDTGEILHAIRTDQTDTGADLNGDAKADLADLQYAVQSMGESRISQTELLGRAESASLADGTAMAEGSIADLLDNKGEIVIKTQDDQEISAENSVGIDFVLAGESSAALPLQGIVVCAPAKEDEDQNIANEITDGEAVIVYEEGGREQEISIPLSAQASVPESDARIARYGASRAAADVHLETDGSLVLDFGDQIAVKRVRIKITGTRKTEPLVHIAKVEFVNNMENRIGAPQLDIPSLNAPIPHDAGLTVSWNAQRNITGYEVYICGPVKNQEEDETQIIRVSDTQCRITAINNKSMKNFVKYTVKVRSVNGDWHSPWSNEQTGEPKPERTPAPPDNVTAVGGHRSISVSWKDMSDANGYMVYYRKAQETYFVPVTEGFSPTAEGTGKLSGTRYVIEGLEDQTEYTLYVISWNEKGWSKPSLMAVAKTKSVTPPKLPDYKLLNTSNGKGAISAHITEAVYGGSGGAHMVSSPLDTEEGNAFGLVDNDYGSYWAKDDWDDGYTYPTEDKGMTITLDNDYEMNYITYAAAGQPVKLDFVRVGYWNQDNRVQKKSIGARILEKKDENDQPFYIIKLDKTITANKVHLSFGRAYTRSTMMVGEIRFYRYDSLEDDIMGLYADEMHTTLKEDVTADVIGALEERLNTPEEASGERHPLYSELKLELKTAKEILALDHLAPAYEVDNRITPQKDGHLGFGGLNAWQPLGKTVNAGEEILVYVGHNTKRTGDSTNLSLVFSQYHAESNSVARTVALKVGRNEITVPPVTSNDFERGGQIYVAYTGNNASDQYAVRVNGGTDIPVLNVYGKTKEERRAAIETYVAALEDYVGTIEAKHGTEHIGTQNEKYKEYDQTNCILNATDIMMKEMMYSLPATQIWAGIRNASDKAAKLDQALQAMEQTMGLFYQHKGLSSEAGVKRGNNALPAQHLNIRYMRMFAGAFMYAAGNHIGIEWGSATLASGPSDWSGFGWGIAHEIGHNINQGSYAVAEITNNYFAQLLTGARRYTYANVYQKVTSGTVGRASNVFTQLAMYWQLHLAFDDNTDDRHMYENYEDQFANLFFARVDTYSRNPEKAPKAGLKLNGGTDQNLMRLACAAASRNILPFFERWGMAPDAETIAYAEKYGEEDTKALYYVNEDARDYRVANPGEERTIEGRDAVQGAALTAVSNRVEIDLSTDQDENLILGYEVSRSMVSNGEKKTQVIGFIPIDTAESTVYTDTVTSINNRVLEYEVRAVDKYLNYSNVKSAGSVKIQTDGVLEKASWTVETNMVSEDDTAVIPDENDPDSGYHESAPNGVEGKKVNSIERILDNDRSADGTYRGSSVEPAVITIDMHMTREVTALKYQGSALSGLTAEVSADGESWVKVKEGYAVLDDDKESIIWFDSVKEEARDNWIGTYDARYVRLTLPQSDSILIREIDICGPSGDNLEFMTADDDTPAFGKLTEDYKYGEKDDDVILAGSLIFTGIYKGNPAYNVVVLYDGNGNVIGEKDANVAAGQVIFAEVPENGELGETSDGTWVYYIEPGQWDPDSLKNTGCVRGELYRVDDAQTLEGERIVSDTYLLEIPDTLPDITFQGGSR